MNHFKFLLLMIIILLLISCAKQEIKIGYIGLLTGKYSTMGKNGRNACELAINVSNTNSNNNFILVSKDFNSDKIENIVNELISEGVKTVVAQLPSSKTIKLVEAAKNKDILIISPSAATDQLTGIDDFFIRTVGQTQLQAAKIAETIINDGSQTAAVIYDISNKDYTVSCFETFKKLFENDSRKIIYHNSLINKNNQEYTKISQEIKKLNPDSILFIASGIDSGIILQKIRQQGSLAKIYGSSWVKSDYFIQHGGRYTEGIKIISLFEVTDKSEEYKKYAEQFIAHYRNEPQYISDYTYEATMMVINGINQIKNDQPSNLKSWILKTSNFNGIVSKYEINSYGDCNRGYSNFIIKKGEFINID